MSLLTKIKSAFGRKPGFVNPAYKPPEVPAELLQPLPDDAPNNPPLPTITHRRPGRVIRADKDAVYQLGQPRQGGRVVKGMPREMQRIKEAQEKTDGAV